MGIFYTCVQQQSVEIVTTCGAYRSAIFFAVSWGRESRSKKNKNGEEGGKIISLSQPPLSSPTSSTTNNSRTLGPGFHPIWCCIGECVSGGLNLRVQQLDVRVETKSSDDVFLLIVVSIQYQYGMIRALFCY